jgi:tRNA(Ile)-lysidine synthase
MASSRKRPSGELVAEVGRFLGSIDLRGKRLALGLSGGVDSVVLLHVLRQHPEFHLCAIHVHHGLSANADAWAQFCSALCARWGVPLAVRRVKLAKKGKGLEAAAREARYAAFAGTACDAVVLAHHLDDQAETVLMNLLRGAGVRGASGMPARSRFDGKMLLRPLLGVSRAAIVAYAGEQSLEWVDDESNADESLTRNFVRRRLAPLIEARFPRWRENLARAARHFAGMELDARALLREFLAEQGLRAPSEAKLIEMLKQLTSGGARILLEHDGMRLRVYRGKLAVAPATPAAPFRPVEWKGERRIALPALGGKLLFKRTRGAGIDVHKLEQCRVAVRLRSGGERLQPDPRRPRRTLKNLFQEAGVPPWQRDRLPLLFCGDDLVWAPGLGVDAHYQATADSMGVVLEWR